VPLFYKTFANLELHPAVGRGDFKDFVTCNSHIKYSFWGEFFTVMIDSIHKVGLYLYRKLLIMELVTLVAPYIDNDLLG